MYLAFAPNVGSAFVFSAFDTRRGTRGEFQLWSLVFLFLRSGGREECGFERAGGGEGPVEEDPAFVHLESVFVHYFGRRLWTEGGIVGAWRDAL